MPNVLNVLDIGRLPLKIDTAFAGLIFYSLGYLFSSNNSIEGFNNKKKNIIYILALFIISSYSGSNGTVNICELIYGDFYLYLFFSIIGIIMVIVLAKTIESCRLFNFIGKNSLFIFSLHSFGLYGYAALLSCIKGEDKRIMVNLSFGEVLVGGVLVTLCMILICYIINKVKGMVTRKSI